MFELGDTELLLLVLLVGSEEGGQAFEEDGFPVGEELRLEVVPAAELGLADGRTDADVAWRRLLAWSSKDRLLVQRQGRITAASTDPLSPHEFGIHTCTPNGCARFGSELTRNASEAGPPRWRFGLVCCTFPPGDLAHVVEALDAHVLTRFWAGVLARRLP